MKKAILKWSCLLVLINFYGCTLNGDDENFQFTVLEAVTADFPDSFDLNGEYEINVVLRRPNDCTFFEGFDSSSPQLTTRIVSAVGTVLTNQECTENLKEVTGTFSFRVDFTQTYLFQFYTGVDAAGNPIYIEYKIPVNE